MALNPSIILGARQPDIVGQMGRAAQTAGLINTVGRENRLMDLFREQGPQIMAGDQGALNALAQLSPDRALGVQQTRLGMDATRQNMSQSAEMHAAQLGEIRRRAAEAAVQAAQQQDAERLAAETAEAKRLVSMALMDPQNADKYLSQSEHTRDFVGQNLDAVAVAIMGAEDGLKYALDQRKPPEAPAAMQTLQMRAQAAGLQPGTPEYSQFMLEGGRTGGFVVETTPEGGVRIAQGSAASGNPKFNEVESKTNIYHTRAVGALEVLEPLANSLTNPVARAVEGDPTGIVRGSLQSEEFQVAKNAGDEFLQAILRKDTGAAITVPEQYLYGRTYLPQPGDSQAVLKAKSDARKRAVRALESGMSAAQMLASERARGEVQVPETAIIEDISSETPPEYLNQTDREIWDVLSPEEREVILGTYK